MDNERRKALGRLAIEQGLFDGAWYDAREREWETTHAGKSFEEFLSSRPDLAPEARARLAGMATVLAALEERTRMGEPTTAWEAQPAPAGRPGIPELVGTRLGGCEILRLIGRGGMGVVFEGRHVALDKRVAVKVLAPHLLAEPSIVERFRLEARSAAQIDHPFVVQVLNVGEEAGLHFLVMQFIEGESLERRVRRAGPLPVAEALRVARAASLALDHAHRRGIVHRDVKPDNILLAADGTVKVTDFGLAKLLSGGSDLSHTGQIMGTPSFISPEQCSGTAVDGRADQYALGVTLHFLLTGRCPFTGDTPIALMYKHVHETPPPIRELNPAVPESVARVVERALAKSPDGRYATMEAFARALEAAHGGLGPPMGTPPPLSATPAVSTPPLAATSPTVLKGTPIPVSRPESLSAGGGGGVASGAAPAGAATPIGREKQVRLALLSGSKGCQVTLAVSLSLLLFVAAGLPMFQGMRRLRMPESSTQAEAPPALRDVAATPGGHPVGVRRDGAAPSTSDPDLHLAEWKKRVGDEEAAARPTVALGLPATPGDLGWRELGIALGPSPKDATLAGEWGGLPAGTGGSFAYSTDTTTATMPGQGKAGEPTEVAIARRAWLEAAVANFRKAIEAEAPRARDYAGLAEGLRLLERPAEELATMDAGLTRLPHDEELLRLRATAFARSGDLERAAADLAAAVAAAGSPERGRETVIFCLRALGPAEDAGKSQERLLRLFAKSGELESREHVVAALKRLLEETRALGQVKQAGQTTTQQEQAK
ncbi:MAG: serine/threonine protein kinase [Planctomycetes bacterium]|nr:serine/threonine protein kinase [Planctomycetota bacterium]